MDLIKFIAKDNGKRTDQFIADNLEKSRSQISDLINKGHITVNGIIAKKSNSIKAGDEITVYFEPEKLPDLTPKKMDLDIIYDSKEYAVVNKPADMVVHPGAGNYDNTLINGLLYEFNIDDDDELRPGVVHRLDKDTSGLLLVAKNRDAREKLSKLFFDRNISKYYYAIAYGLAKFKTKSIIAPIARDKRDRQRMAVSDDGKYAETNVIVMEQYKKAFLAEINLITGRTHQIRVHMKHIYHPLLGDTTYAPNNVAKMFARQALHAGKISFIDPFTNKKQEFTAPLPQDMLDLIGLLK